MHLQFIVTNGWHLERLVVLRCYFSNHKRKSFCWQSLSAIYHFPDFVAFSLNGHLTVKILMFCRAENGLQINSRPGHVLPTVSTEKLFMHAEKLFNSMQLLIWGCGSNASWIRLCPIVHFLFIQRRVTVFSSAWLCYCCFSLSFKSSQSRHEGHCPNESQSLFVLKNIC